MSYMESARSFAKNHWLLQHGKVTMNQLDNMMIDIQTDKIWFHTKTTDFFISDASKMEPIADTHFVKIQTSDSKISVYVNSHGFYIEDYEVSLPLNPSDILLSYNGAQSGAGHIILNGSVEWNTEYQDNDISDSETFKSKPHWQLIIIHQLLMAFTWKLNTDWATRCSVSSPNELQWMRHPDGIIKCYFEGALFNMSTNALSPNNFNIKRSPKQIKLKPKHYHVFHTKNQMDKTTVLLESIGVTPKGTFLMYGMGRYYSNAFKQRLGEFIFQNHQMIFELDEALGL